MREKQLRSIAFSVVNSQRKGYPPENGAHIALSLCQSILLSVYHQSYSFNRSLKYILYFFINFI